MFPYDSDLLAVLASPPQTIGQVIAQLQAIDTLCDDADGLKWFNWLYLAVTESVASLVAANAFHDSAWIATLDVHFATLYFDALRAQLSGAAPPECWKLFLDRRNVAAL